MKLLIFLPIFLISFHSSFSQTNEINDSLVTEICNTLNANKGLTDSLRLVEIRQTHIYPILRKLDSTDLEEALKFISFRLQKNCNEYLLIINRLYPNKGDWIQLDKKPTSSLDKKTCSDFLKIGTYYYLEGNGDTTRLTIKNNFWIDHFTDGTYSKLKFKRTGDCAFEIEFIESNNDSRKYSSRPGDKYDYQILEQGNGYYLLSVVVAGMNAYTSFKLYY